MSVSFQSGPSEGAINCIFFPWKVINDSLGNTESKYILLSERKDRCTMVEEGLSIDLGSLTCVWHVHF